MSDLVEKGARALAERILPGSTRPGDLYESDRVTNWGATLRKNAKAVLEAVGILSPAMDAVIFDIDGTIADVAHRRPYLDQDPPHWAAFNAAYGDDQISQNIVRLAKQLRGAGNRIVLCSGRSEDFRRGTELWLTFNEVPFDALYMRPAKDSRKDHIVKMELLDRILADGFKVWLVVDDRSSVVAAWRARGLTCLQCAEGAF